MNSGENAMRAFLLPLCLIVAAALPARGADDMRAVNALWTDFTAALRRGDYRQAYAMFSPESRAAMPYPQFTREYGPLSAAREMVLAPPASLSTQTDGDWAEIAFSGDNPAGQFRVGAAIVKNQGHWGLVAARNEGREKLEAGVRNLLALAGQWRNAPDAARRLDGLIRQELEKKPLLARYKFEAAAGSMRALPQTPGLRAFHLDEWGMARPGAEPGPQSLPPASPPSRTSAPTVPATLPPQPAPAVPPKLVNGLPELTEPPMPGDVANPVADPDPAFDMPPLPPPPLPPVNRYQPEPVRLPETIG